MERKVDYFCGPQLSRLYEDRRDPENPKPLINLLMELLESGLAGDDNHLSGSLGLSLDYIKDECDDVDAALEEFAIHLKQHSERIVRVIDLSIERFQDQPDAEIVVPEDGEIEAMKRLARTYYNVLYNDPNGEHNHDFSKPWICEYRASLNEAIELLRKLRQILTERAGSA